LKIAVTFPWLRKFLPRRRNSWHSYKTC